MTAQYQNRNLMALMEGNQYPGRGIVLGKTPDGKHAAAAYFIMGRSANSRNRVFRERNGEVFTEPFDAAKVEDPSLIIYAAVRQFENHLIVTNGDQTDTIYEGLAAGRTFEEALTSRTFEPDGPNFTPRISGMINLGEKDFTYEISILKNMDESGRNCARYHFCYPALAGTGHLIHTYQGDGNPLPTFAGEPVRVEMTNEIDLFTNNLWEHLNEENRISLYVRYIDLETGAVESRMVNKHIS